MDVKFSNVIMYVNSKDNEVDTSTVFTVTLMRFDAGTILFSFTVLTKLCSLKRLKSLHQHLHSQTSSVYENVCNQLYCVCFGPWPFNLSFLSFLLFDWVGVLSPQLSKVLKLVHWACCILFPPCPCRSRSSISSNCCLCVWFRREPTLFPGWCK